MGIHVVLCWAATLTAMAWWHSKTAHTAFLIFCASVSAWNGDCSLLSAMSSAWKLPSMAYTGTPLAFCSTSCSLAWLCLQMSSPKSWLAACAHLTLTDRLLAKAQAVLAAESDGDTSSAEGAICHQDLQ